MRSVKIRNFTILLLMSMIGACIKLQEGCLDIEATNYMVGADQNCCCTYPRLLFNLNYLAHGLAFNPERIFQDEQGVEYQIRRFAFYLSEISLISGGTSYPGIDSLWIWRESGNADPSRFLYLNNINLINRTGFLLNAGEFRGAERYDEVSVRFGLPPEVNSNLQNLYQRGHPLFIQVDSMHTFERQEGYLFFRMDIRLINTGELKTITISGDANSRILNYSVDFLPVRGQDRILNMDINVPGFLDGIDLVHQTEAQMVDLILSNLERAIHCYP